MPPESAAHRLNRLPPATRRIALHNTRICRGWVEWLRAQDRAPITVHQYGAKCEELVEFLGKTRLENVLLADLEDWVARPRTGRGKGQLGADSTRNKDVVVLRGLFKWAVEHGVLKDNPAADLKLPKVRNENPRAIDPEVWQQFWTSPTLTDTERAVYGLGFFCGLRRAEICHLELRHFDMSQQMLVGFRRKGDRGRTSGTTPYVSLAWFFAQKHPQLLSTPEAFLDPLQKLCADRAMEGAKWLVPWGEESERRYRKDRVRTLPSGMTSPDQLNHRLTQALKRAGLPEQSFSPHALRHSFVTYLLKGGATLEEVSKMANHSNLDVTLKYVTLPDDPIARHLDAGEFNLRGSRWQTNKDANLNDNGAGGGN